MSMSTNGDNLSKRIVNMLRPSRTIPDTPWRADSTWSLGTGKHHIQRLSILFFGLTMFGIGEAFLVVAGLGNSPWMVLSEGISIHTVLNIGESTFLVSVLVLLLWIPLRQKPGFGTIANIVVIAAAIEVGLLFIPVVDNSFLKYLYTLLGIALVGAGSSLYITCGLGSGPRDGLMTAIHRRTGVRVGRVRLGIELSVVAMGALLGGNVGLGTLLFAGLIGQSIAVALGVVARITAK